MTITPQCVVSDRYRFIYVLIAKNATSTLRKAFREKHYESFECGYNRIEGEKRAAYFTFAMLRDPIARFLSAYQEISIRIQGGQLSENGRAFLSMSDTQERFQAFLKEAECCKWDVHILDQHEFLRNLPMDFLGTVEELDRSLGLVLDRVGAPALGPLPVRRSRAGRERAHRYDKFYVKKVDHCTETRIRSLYLKDAALHAEARALVADGAIISAPASPKPHGTG